MRPFLWAPIIEYELIFQEILYWGKRVRGPDFCLILHHTYKVTWVSATLHAAKIRGIIEDSHASMVKVTKTHS